jgi:hypothetical protein
VDLLDLSQIMPKALYLIISAQHKQIVMLILLTQIQLKSTQSLPIDFVIYTKMISIAIGSKMQMMINLGFINKIIWEKKQQFAKELFNQNKTLKLY